MANTYKYLDKAGLEQFLTNIIARYANTSRTAGIVGYADALQTGRSIAVQDKYGDAMGTVTFDGTQNVTLSYDASDKHDHTLAHVTDLASVVSFVRGANDAITGVNLAASSTAHTYADGDNSDRIATTSYVKTAIDNILSTSKAMTFEGVVANQSDINTALARTDLDEGDTYVVSMSFEATLNGASVWVEPGDMLVCTSKTNKTFEVIQTNINGAVTAKGGQSGATSVDQNLVIYDGISGRVVQDANWGIQRVKNTDATLRNYAVLYGINDIVQSFADLTAASSTAISKSSSGTAASESIVTISINDTAASANTFQVNLSAYAKLDQVVTVTRAIYDEIQKIYAGDAKYFDTAMSDSSVRGVQNKVIKKYSDDKFVADATRTSVDASGRYKGTVVNYVEDYICDVKLFGSESSSYRITTSEIDALFA